MRASRASAFDIATSGIAQVMLLVQLLNVIHCQFQNVSFLQLSRSSSLREEYSLYFTAIDYRHSRVGNGNPDLVGRCILKAHLFFHTVGFK